jgi:hypothetical protein
LARKTSDTAGAPSLAAPRSFAGDLRVGEPNDAYEQEADRVADEVMTAGPTKRHWSLSAFAGGMSLQRKCSCGASGGSDGECEDCKQKEKSSLQRKAIGPAGSGMAPPVVHDVLSSPGQALDGATRDYFETRFGHDFSRVRVHSDVRAAESARAVSALAYTVNQHVVFGTARYQPGSADGRRLLAHELAHTIQQGGAGRVLQRQEDKYAKLSIPELRKLLKTDPEAVEALRLRYRAMTPGQLKPYTASDAVAQSVYESKTIVPKEAAGTGPFSNRDIADALDQELQQQRAASGIARRSPGATMPDVNRTEGGTMGAAKTDVPGLENRTFTGRSPQAGGEVNPASKFPPPTDPAVLPQTHGHAEQHLADQLEEALKAIPREQLKGKRVWMLIEQEPCSTCAQGIATPTEAGVLAKLSREFPELTFEIKSLTNNSLIVLQGGTRTTVSTAAASSAQNAAAAKSGTPASAQVSTKIEVTNAVKQADGSVISEVEYNFGENLKQINEGAPAGAELPSRVVVRVTQNSEGVITSVESLSGQPQALAEALAQRTLTPAIAGEAAGAAEGAASGASRAMLFKGLKIAGWSAFAVITGYQLYKATPRERPKVLAEAGGGLAAGIGTTYLVCNALLDIETAGWGLVICGFIAGGAGGYAGSKAAGAAYDAYDEATATPLEKAFHALAGTSANERVVFNIIANRLGYTANCIDAGFVNSFMAKIPGRLQDAEAVLLAGQLASAPIAPPPIPKRAESAAPRKKKPGVCPSCHGRSPSNEAPALADFDQIQFDAIMAAPTCSSVLAKALSALDAAVKTLPRYQRAPGDLAHHPDPGTDAAASRPRTDTSAFPTLAQQIGKGGCPGGNCHKPSGADKPLLPSTVKPTTSEQQAILNWVQSQNKSAPTGGAHPTPSGTKLAVPSGGFPSLEEQQGAPCPNCHTAPRKDDPFKGFGGLGSGPSGTMTDADRQKLLDFITAQQGK